MPVAGEMINTGGATTRRGPTRPASSWAAGPGELPRIAGSVRIGHVPAVGWNAAAARRLLGPQPDKPL